MPARSTLCLGFALLSFLFTATLIGQPVKDAPRSPLAPEEALKTFKLPDGYRVELFAAEPHVVDPVAMAFDENGRVYVAEMGDYPVGPKGGRIKLLEDTDGDGWIDKSTVFLEGLPFPNGVMPWRGGVLVTAAPDIIYLKDTDGDGKADMRQVIFTGFTRANPQHRVNGLTLGLDNWIYGADGDSFTGIRRADTPDTKTISLRGSDFRFRTDFSGFETISGRSQFAMTFDDWGNRFINANSNHIRQPVLPQHYLKRNPNLAVSEVVYETAGGRSWPVYPISKMETRFNDLFAAGHFTSACSVTIYRGDAFPELYGNAFTCEPVHNLVHRDLLDAEGIGFRAKSPYQDSEFLASTDNWFRPVNLCNGPDGTLYVVDMYRAVIEHPQWIPLDTQKKINVRAGDDRGRIYRIVRKDGPKTVRPRLGETKTAELVALFEHVNAWHRTTAQRLLLERQDKTAIEPLRKLARDSKSPRARLHALWMLEGLGGLDDDLVEQALKDRDWPQLREHGLRLAEPRLAKSESLREAVLKLGDDGVLRVRFQAAFTLGEMRDERALSALVYLARRDGVYHWSRSAVLSSVPESGAKLLALLRKEHPQFLEAPKGSNADFVRELAAMIGARRNAEEVAELLRLVVVDGGEQPSRWQMAAISGLGESLRRSGQPMEKYLGDAEVAATLKKWTARAVETASATDRDLAERLDALTLLTLLPSPGEAARLKGLLRPQHPQQVQLAAVRALAALPGRESVTDLLADWDSRTAPVRREIVGVLLVRADRAHLLLDAMEKGDVRLTEFDTARRDQLLRHADKTISARARKLFDTQKPTNQQKVVEEWTAKVLALTGDAVRGQKVYAEHCANCHRLHGQGVAVGPDLASVSNRAKEALLVDILDPSQALDPVYVDYVLVTQSGQAFNGIIGAESATSVTLRRAERQETTILRKDIAEMRSTGVSLMPAGVQDLLKPQDLADLLELLRRERLH